MKYGDPAPLTEEQLVRDRERAIELLRDLVWSTTSNEVDDKRWREAKKWLESVHAWRKV